jgi:xanthine dehydrogenase large subunit
MAEVSRAKDPIVGGVHAERIHDSSRKHVDGSAVYIDDIPEPPRMLQVYIAMSTRAHARITELDLSAVRTAPGVACVLTATDIPGINDASPIMGDDPVFAVDTVHYVGQSLFAVAAPTIDEARAAAQLARVEYEDLEAHLTVDEAMEASSFVLPPMEMKLGDADKALKSAPHKISGRMRIGGQDHFYLEGQIALVLPGEDADVHVYSSTQHPSEVQHNVAKVLGVPDHAVTVELRRMGGGFGGKESQPALMAAIAALVVRQTGRAAKVRLDRDDDMEMTGKRHDFRIDYDVSFDDEGRIVGITYEQAARCGMSADLSASICDRAMFHADNCYFLENVRILSHRCRTNTVSNTAFRGFGGPQGMVAMERVIDRIALHLDLDPLDVRKINLYGENGRDITPYHMTVEDNVAPELIARLEETSDYRARRQAAREFNATSEVLKKGISLTPVKFGISFTAGHLNQAGALVHVYKDGSVHLNHGGTEMGQGLFTKVAQVVAEEFQIDIERVKITATTTAKVPNTSATAASSGSDLNGMAALAASRTIKDRLIEHAASTYNVSPEQIVFLPNRVRVGNREMSFADLVSEAYMARVSLSATGFYKTPKIHWDGQTGRGRPFYYFAYGAAVSEVLLDTLTGENRVLRVDILHDAGKSLNPVIDMGQIEGGFIQGMGWLTTEELWWNEAGRLMTHAPSTYKIPACSDRPDDMRIEIWDKGRNVEQTIYRSKAVGEPPLMLAIAVHCALTDAVASVADYKVFPDLDAPATAEHLLHAVDDLRQRSGEGASA